MKKKFNYTKSTFYISLVILCFVLIMAGPYVSSVAQFVQGVQAQPIVSDNNLTVCQDGSCEYLTIQDAIDFSIDFDTIQILDSGIYNELVTVDKKITLDCNGAVIDGTGFTRQGLILLESSNLTIENCNLYGADFAIMNSPNTNLDSVIIRNNVFENIGSMMNFKEFSNGLIIYNSNDGWGRYRAIGGIFIDTIISDNYIRASHGIYIFSGSHDNIITSNDIATRAANNNVFALSDSHNNTIVGNSFGMGYVYFTGIVLGGSNPDNIFYSNNFNQYAIVRYSNLTGTDTSIFDNGYPEGGNYWYYQPSKVDMYSGINQDKSGSDGIVDDSYDVVIRGIDNYPLLESFEGRINHLPVSMFTIDKMSRIVEGDLLEFDASSSYDIDGEIVSWKWEIRQIIDLEEIVIESVIIQEEVDSELIKNKIDDGIGLPVEAQPELIFAEEEPPSTSPPVELQGNVYEYTFDDSGKYVIELTVTDDSGDSDSYSMGLIVNELVVEEESNETETVEETIVPIPVDDSDGSIASGGGGGVSYDR